MTELYFPLKVNRLIFPIKRQLEWIKKKNNMKSYKILAATDPDTNMLTI